MTTIATRFCFAVMSVIGAASLVAMSVPAVAIAIPHAPVAAAAR